MGVADLSPGFLTLSQAAERLGSISEMTLRREVERGHLRASRIGRCLRVTPEALDEWRLSRPATREGR